MNPWHERIVEHFYNNTNNFAENNDFSHIGPVTINKENHRNIFKKWAKEDFELPNWRAEVIWPFDNDEFYQFIGFATAINAHYRLPGHKEKFTVLWRGRKWTGAFAMSACLMRAIEIGHISLCSRPLCSYPLLPTKEDRWGVFTKNTNYTIPLWKERFKVLDYVVDILLSKYQGYFSNLFEWANYKCFDNGNGICERLVKDFPKAFCDTRTLDGEVLPFHKKALLLPLEYCGRAEDGEVLPRIKDIESISPVADYELPKVLWSLGIFRYTLELERKIKALEEIPAGSVEETCIRYATVIEVGRLLQDINVEREKLKKAPINMAHLDYRLWNSGRNSNLPHHITQTVDY